MVKRNDDSEAAAPAASSTSVSPEGTTVAVEGGRLRVDMSGAFGNPVKGIPIKGKVYDRVRIIAQGHGQNTAEFKGRVFKGGQGEVVDVSELGLTQGELMEAKKSGLLVIEPPELQHDKEVPSPSSEAFRAKKADADTPVEKATR